MEKLINKFKQICDTDEDYENLVCCALESKKIAIGFANRKLRELGLIDFGTDDNELFNKFIEEEYGK